VKLRVQGSPGLTDESKSRSEASKSLTVSPPVAANNDIDDRSEKVVADYNRKCLKMEMDLEMEITKLETLNRK
jgi:hypothetical protein